MKKEKTCRSCKHSSYNNHDIVCQIDCKFFDKWEPKEPEIIQISGEQAINLIKVMNGPLNISMILDEWEKAGYIKKDIIEEAEESYKKYVSLVRCMLDVNDDSYELIEKLYSAMQKLKQG